MILLWHVLSWQLWEHSVVHLSFDLYWTTTPLWVVEKAWRSKGTSRRFVKAEKGILRQQNANLKKKQLLLETNCEDNKPVSSFLSCKCRKGGNLNEMSHSCKDHDWAQGELLRFLWRKAPLPWQLLATAKRMSGGEHEQLFGRKRATLILSSYSTNAAPRLSN